MARTACTFQGQNIWHTPSAIRVVYSDASDTGYGVYMVEHGCHIAQGQQLPQEAKQSLRYQPNIKIKRSRKTDDFSALYSRLTIDKLTS